MKLLLLLLLISPFSYALTGLEIMQKVDARDDGHSVISTMNMLLIDKQGKKRNRQMQTFSLDIDDNTEHRAIFFRAPVDVKNTAFLTYDYQDDDKDDDQWLYLPALKKTKRIPASDKDASFMGSDFSYSDMTDRILSDYTYKILKTSFIKRKTGKVKVWLIEITAKSQKTIDETGYSKSVVYVRQDNFMVTRAKLTLQKTNRFKYLDVRKIKKINGVWVAIQTSMTSKQGKRTTHKTLLTQSNIQINAKVSPEIFSIRTIEKGL